MMRYRLRVTRKGSDKMKQPEETVVILDCGGRYNQHLAKHIRELGVYSELVPANIKAEEIKQFNPKGIIISGELKADPAEPVPHLDPALFELDLPILGIGVGMQLMMKHFDHNGELEQDRDYGERTIYIKGYSPLFEGLDEKQTVWLRPVQVVRQVPANFEVKAEDSAGLVVALEDVHKRMYALQFHPEVEQTPAGKDMLRSFLFQVCRCQGTWSVDAFIEQAIEAIREKVGTRRVLCALSGGVDSSVVAALVHRAIGDQLVCMFVDHGLLRLGEAESVMDTFQNKFAINVIKVDASRRFLDKLKGVTDPEEKRKIIGHEFIYVFEEEASKLDDVHFLAQGTLYTDIVESSTGTGQTIKSHHNVGGLPEQMKFELIEPLRPLFKDEVRQVGEKLGLPAEIVWRQPFPGPGLAIRVLGEVTEEKLSIVRQADAILREEIRKAGLERSIWQYFAILPNIRSVGTTGDRRTYDYTVGIRAVTSIDGISAEWARIPYDVLDTISRRICTEVTGVNRVVYDITPSLRRP